MTNSYLNQLRSLDEVLDFGFFVFLLQVVSVQIFKKVSVCGTALVELRGLPVGVGSESLG